MNNSRLYSFPSDWENDPETEISAVSYSKPHRTGGPWVAQKPHPLRCSQLADSPGVRIADIGAHKQMFLGVTKLNPNVYDSFLNIMVPHSKEGSSAGVRRPPALGEEFSKFILPRKNVRNSEVVFAENTPPLFPSQQVTRVFTEGLGSDQNRAAVRRHARRRACDLRSLFSRFLPQSSSEWRRRALQWRRLPLHSSF